MQTIQKQYIKRNGLTLKVHLYYSLGGYSYMTCETEARGYYLSVSPVEIKEIDNGIVSETYQAYTGVKTLLLEVKRKSKKAERQAIRIAEEKLDTLINHVLEAKSSA